MCLCPITISIQCTYVVLHKNYVVHPSTRLTRRSSRYSAPHSILCTCKSTPSPISQPTTRGSLAPLSDALSLESAMDWEGGAAKLGRLGRSHG